MQHIHPLYVMQNITPMAFNRLATLFFAKLIGLMAIVFSNYSTLVSTLFLVNTKNLHI